MFYLSIDLTYKIDIYRHLCIRLIPLHSLHTQLYTQWLVPSMLPRYKARVRWYCIYRWTWSGKNEINDGKHGDGDSKGSDGTSS